MFDIPEAKRVRRSDLYSRSQSPSPPPSELDSELEAQLQARLASLYDSAYDTSILAPASQPTRPPNGNLQPNAEDAQDEEEPPEFEFRLFSAGENDTAEPQKIILELDEEEGGDGGFVVPNRNPKYYFAEKAVGEEQWRFEAAALTGDEVLGLSKRRAWGLEVPWRVKVLKVVGSPKSASAGAETGQVVLVEVGRESKRKRPGKKRRVILRQRKKKSDEVLEKRRKEQELKDETEREKKTRRNREKKVKQRLKEKAKKAEDSPQSATGVDAANDVVAVAGGEGSEMTN
ncbi:hypothetical protein LSUE1_G004873 [Lachnellula suecica]|uniref:Uncharacterized protein n=1 Tax=Lachnellula suecica TaxID=602035 RepID=A0A8T9C7V9_9HELO|nr:hypothetical protein LSUE1_G004873 [Lachnellula suecica]